MTPTLKPRPSRKRAIEHGPERGVIDVRVAGDDEDVELADVLRVHLRSAGGEKRPEVAHIAPLAAGRPELHELFGHGEGASLQACAIPALSC